MKSLKKWWLCTTNFMKNFGWKMEARRILIEKVFSTWLPVGANVHRWFWLEYRWFWSRWEASVRAPNVGLRRSTPRKCTLVGNYGHSGWTKSPEKQRVITDGLEWEKDRDHQMVLLQGTLWTQKSSMRWSLLHSKESTVFCSFLPC